MSNSGFICIIYSVVTLKGCSWACSVLDTSKADSEVSVLVYFYSTIPADGTRRERDKCMVENSGQRDKSRRKIIRSRAKKKPKGRLQEGVKVIELFSVRC